MLLRRTHSRRTAFFLGLWALLPLLMHWLTRPAPRLSHAIVFEIGNNAFLRGMARRTWRFFDDLVGPTMNWLPPDNSQLALRVEVAHRTSPTNIGLWLTSALAARDFGYLTPDDFWRRCSQTIDTLERLERYEGHLLNWYDTQNAGALVSPLCFDSGQRQSARLPVGAGARVPRYAARARC